MRILHSITRLLAVGVPVAFLAGCDLLTDANDPIPNNGDPVVTDLESEYGGYSYTDETEAFGDPDLMKMEMEESPVPVADPDTIPSDSSFVVRILWGQLRGNRDATTPIDWSGSVQVSEGALGVLRTIAFERPGDHLLPRENRQTVGFVSRTLPSFDGLLLVVRAAPPDSGAPSVSGDATLRFATTPFTGEWSLSELRGANLVIPVDDLGNAVSITAMPVRRDHPCPNGFVRGHWMVREGERGLLQGLWMGPDARPMGHLRGHFGVNEAGERVWFAKILGRGGRLIGLARGGWAPSEDPAQPGGTFAGHFSAREGEVTGNVGGHYLPARRGERGGAGFFEGRWGANCDGGPTEE